MIVIKLGLPKSDRAKEIKGLTWSGDAYKKDLSQESADALVNVLELRVFEKEEAEKAVVGSIVQLHHQM